MLLRDENFSHQSCAEHVPNGVPNSVIPVAPFCFWRGAEPQHWQRQESIYDHGLFTVRKHQEETVGYRGHNVATNQVWNSSPSVIFNCVSDLFFVFHFVLFAKAFRRRSIIFRRRGSCRRRRGCRRWRQSAELAICDQRIARLCRQTQRWYRRRFSFSRFTLYYPRRILMKRRRLQLIRVGRTRPLNRMKTLFLRRNPLYSLSHCGFDGRRRLQRTFIAISFHGHNILEVWFRATPPRCPRYRPSCRFIVRWLFFISVNSPLSHPSTTRAIRFSRVSHHVHLKRVKERRYDRDR